MIICENINRVIMAPHCMLKLMLKFWTLDRCPISCSQVQAMGFLSWVLWGKLSWCISGIYSLYHYIIDIFVSLLSLWGLCTRAHFTDNFDIGNGNIICPHSNNNHVNITEFCTCHDSTAVMTCAKFCDVHKGRPARSEIITKQICYFIWNTMGKSSVKWMLALIWS